MLEFVQFMDIGKIPKFLLNFLFDQDEIHKLCIFDQLNADHEGKLV